MFKKPISANTVKVPRLKKVYQYPCSVGVKHLIIKYVVIEILSNLNALLIREKNIALSIPINDLIFFIF